MQDFRGIIIREVRALRRHNFYAYMPVLRVVMDIGEYAERPSNSFEGFTDRLVKMLPGLQQHECSVGRPGGFIERLHRGTYLPHICEHIALELQNLMGFEVTFGRARGTGERNVYQVIVAYEEEEPARRAFDAALQLTLAAMHNESFDVERALDQLRQIADEYRLGPSTAAIVRAAQRRGIPVMRLTPTASLVQLGYGCYQKRIVASETSNTSAIAVELCQEKPMTNRMLKAVGVPVPDGRPARDPDQAWAAAQEIGFPVVMKPEAGNQGKGVSLGLRTEAEVRKAYEVASQFDHNVLVERQITGADYRLLVVNGRMVAAARRDPAHVVGDGKSTIQQLVETINRDPRRRPGHSDTLTQIKLDEASDLALVQQSFTRQSIPDAGQVVRLRLNANLSTGGTATDVTDIVHPRNARLAELAAQILALDVAGIDMLCQNIRRPLEEQDGAIVEVNAAPGLRMHLHPTSGKARNVGIPIVEMLYPHAAPTRIPIIAVTGTNGKTTVSRLISHIYETSKWIVGRTSTEGIYIGESRIVAGDCSGPRSAEAVLLHPQVEVAVFEMARGGILREGLGYDSCTVGVVTNISSDHLGLKGINTLEDLAKVKRVVVEAVDRDGHAVLNADDPLVAEMAAASEGPVIYFSTQPTNPIVAAHLAEGGKCTLLRGDTIVLQTGEHQSELIELERVPFTLGGKLKFQVANTMAAVAAAWAGGLNPAIIARALTTFKTDPATTPGRFNLFNLRGVEVIMDYAHNEAAMEALADAIGSLDKRRTVAVMGLPGDRRDGDLISTASATVPFVDTYVLHDLRDRRGRKPNEVPQLLQTRLPSNVPREVVSDQLEAIRKAWSLVRPGDRLVVIIDEVEPAMEAIRAIGSSGEDDVACAPLTAEPVSSPAMGEYDIHGTGNVHTYRRW